MEPHDERWTPRLEAAKRRREDLHEALVEAEEAISGPAAGREDAWALGVAKAMTHLRDAFDEHVTGTEQPGGLYEEIIQRAPRFQRKIERLHEDHPEIQEEIRGLLRRLESRSSSEGDVDDVRDDIQRVLGRIVRHRQRGADLVWEAYNVDIGGHE